MSAVASHNQQQQQQDQQQQQQLAEWQHVSGERDALRLSWNLWPYSPPSQSSSSNTQASRQSSSSTSSQVQSIAQQVLQTAVAANSQSADLLGLMSMVNSSGKLPLPISCLYSPASSAAAAAANQSPIRSAPLICGNSECRAILNPFCVIDPRSRQWICCFCKSPNFFNQNYNMYFESNQMPPEMQANSTTIDYVFPSNQPPTIYLFLLDVSVNDENLESIKQNLTLILNRLPRNSLVGLLSFGSIVRLYEIVEADNFYKINIFSGSKQVSEEIIREFVENQITGQQSSPGLQASANNAELSENYFFKKIGKNALEFSNILQSIKSDMHSIRVDARQKQCAGVALRFASDLLYHLYPNQNARIVSFIGGPITYGPGAIATESKKQSLRQYMDINRGHPLAVSALKFFSKLGNDSAKRNHIYDIYSGHGDQIGIYELKYLTLLTGGEIVMSDNFSSNLFRQSIMKFYNNQSISTIADSATSAKGANFASAAMIEVKMSPGLKVMGCIGPCQSMNVKSKFVSPITVGMSNTVRWRCNSLSPNTTLAFYFETCNDAESCNAIVNKYQSFGYLQFITSSSYNNAVSAEKRLRVTTVCRSWMDVTNGLRVLAPGFDEACAITCAARYAIYTLDYDGNPDASKWLDKCLIAIVKQFANYTANNASSLTLPQNFHMFPQFMFHLRRSNLINNVLCSPDEATFHRQLFLRSPLADTLTMMQPVLLSYSFQGFNPAVLDVTSIRPDNVLVLDTYFVVLVYYGQALSSWIQQGLHRSKEYAHIQDLIDYAKRIALEKVNSRNPTPRFVLTFHDGSQARFLFSKVNPSNNNSHSAHGSVSGTMEQGAVKSILTDDVSLQAFIESLKKLVVREES